MPEEMGFFIIVNFLLRNNNSKLLNLFLFANLKNAFSLT